MAKIRRSYKGAAQQAVLDNAGVSSTTQTSILLTTSPSTWPTGKFFVVVAPGTAQEEKMCVTLSGSTLTVVDPNVVSTSSSENGRGVDNTTARSTIAGGSVVYPVYTAIDADEANELTSTYTTRGDIVYHGASTFARLAVGTSGQVLTTNGTDPSWGKVGTTAINDGAVTLAQLATAVKNLLVPVGSITAYAGAAAPTGWLLCDGSAIDSSYTALRSLVGANTPDLRGHTLVGKSTTAPFDGSLLSKFGSTTSTALHTHPGDAHTHSIEHNHAPSGGHIHSLSGGVNIYDSGTSGNWGLIATNQTGSLNAFIQNTSPTSTNSASVDIANFTGNSGAASSANTGESSVGVAHGNVQPSALVTYIIKHD